MNAEEEQRVEDRQEQIRLLVTCLHNGDSQTAGVLLDRLCRQSLYGLGWAILRSPQDAEDAVQEVFRKVLATNRLPDAERFDRWLLTVARNQCRNMRRDNGRRKDDRVLPPDSELNADTTGILSRLTKGEDAAEARRRFEELREVEREVVWLRRVEELSRAEIAELLGISVSLVKSRLYEAERKLRGDGPPCEKT